MNIHQRMESFQLTKWQTIKASQEAAEHFDKARILIDHPGSGREWEIVGPDSVPGFWHLFSAVPIGRDYYNERMDYQRFALVLSDKEFQRI